MSTIISERFESPMSDYSHLETYLEGYSEGLTIQCVDCMVPLTVRYNKSMDKHDVLCPSCAKELYLDTCYECGGYFRGADLRMDPTDHRVYCINCKDETYWENMKLQLIMNQIPMSRRHIAFWLYLQPTSGYVMRYMYGQDMTAYIGDNLLLLFKLERYVLKNPDYKYSSYENIHHIRRALLGNKEDMKKLEKLFNGGISENENTRWRDRLAQRDPDWAIKNAQSDYATGKKLAVLYDEAARYYKIQWEQGYRCVAHLRDGEFLSEIAKRYGFQMIPVITSRPITTGSRGSKHVLSYLERMIPKDVAAIHFDSGFSGSIPRWMRDSGWNVAGIKMISTSASDLRIPFSKKCTHKLGLEYGSFSNGTVDGLYNCIVSDRIEGGDEGFNQRLEQLDSRSWYTNDLGKEVRHLRYNKNPEKFWATIYGICDELGLPRKVSKKEMSNLRKHNDTCWNQPEPGIDIWKQIERDMKEQGKKASFSIPKALPKMEYKYVIASENGLCLSPEDTEAKQYEWLNHNKAEMSIWNTKKNAYEYCMPDGVSVYLADSNSPWLVKNQSAEEITDSFIDSVCKHDNVFNFTSDEQELIKLFVDKSKKVEKIKTHCVCTKGNFHILYSGSYHECENHLTDLGYYYQKQIVAGQGGEHWADPSSFVLFLMKLEDAKKKKQIVTDSHYDTTENDPIVE